MIRVTIDLIDTKDNRHNRCVGIGYITSNYAFSDSQEPNLRSYTYRLTNWIPNINRIWLEGTSSPFIHESRNFWEMLYFILKSIFGK